MSENAPAQITISTRGNEICETLKKLNYFDDKKDVYVAAICLAMALDLPLDPSITTPDNGWHAASVFHSTGRDLSAVMRLMGYEEEGIMVKGKMLAEAGLRYIEEKRISQADLIDVLLNVNQ